MEEYNGSATDIPGIVRKVSNIERAFLWKPNSNVSMIVRIRGEFSEEKLKTALERVRQIHPFVGARIVFDSDHNAYFATDNVPPPRLKTIKRDSDAHWFKELQNEIQIPFEMEKGPLIRFILVHSKEVSDLVIICSHSICDGMALVYLVRDLLENYTDFTQEIKVLIPPHNRDFLPEVDSTSSQDMKRIIDYANMQWKRNPYYFHQEDYNALYSAYWDKNDFCTVLLELEPYETKLLSKQCKENGVTIGSAVTTAFIAAHEEVSGPFVNNQEQIMVPYDLRRHAITPIGDVFCLCIGAPQFPFTYNARRSFWENSSLLQKEIRQRVEKLEYSDLGNPDFDPTLIDALSSFAIFKKTVPDAYDRTETLSRFLQDKDNIAFVFAEKSQEKIPGTVPSNLGRLSIPETYGDLRIDRMVFIPAVIDHIPLILGGIAMGGKMVFALCYPEPKDLNGSLTNEMIQIRNRVLEYLGFPDKATEEAIL